MTSKFMSRLINYSASPSVYEEMRQDDANRASASFHNNNDNDPYHDLDEENLGGRYHDEELADALADAGSVSSSRFQDASPEHPPAPLIHSTKGKESAHSHLRSVKSTTGGNYDNADTGSYVDHHVDDDDDDDDVPPSLLVERDKTFSMHELPPRPSEINEHVIQINEQEQKPGSFHSTANPRWGGNHSSSSVPRTLGGGLAAAHPKDKAMWRWNNVQNLDNFLKEVYCYYRSNGLYSICLQRCLNLLTLTFVVGFSTFLLNCINYRAIPHSNSLNEVMIPRCAARMSGISNFLLWVFTLLWVLKACHYVMDTVRLSRIRDFYHYLLGVTDRDIETISWQEIVLRIMELRDLNPLTAHGVSSKHRQYLCNRRRQRMDAQDIANRIMRKDNYLIAMINKDVLELTLPIPFLKHRPLYSRTLEWNLNLCIFDYVFDETGQVHTAFLKENRRKRLSESLRRRFVFVAILNFFIAPFVIAYFLVHHFFRYFSEYQKNPALVGTRQYTPFAEWKFREFNELGHLFQRRLNMSYPFAARYVDQFPRRRTTQIARFVGFIAGALASVLALASLIDPELFLGFEITPDRTVLFYLGMFGSIWAGARGMVPGKTVVFEPEFALREVIDYTHYLPSRWKGKLHSEDVKEEFATLYQYKVLIFAEEILGMIICPFMLLFCLPKCSERIIDFFREFTIHVDGLGYVCLFAEFNFHNGAHAIALQGRLSQRGADDPRDNYFSTKDDKMLASYFGFLENYNDTNLGPGYHHHHRPLRRSPLGANPPSPASSPLRNESSDRFFSRPAYRGGNTRVPALMRSVLLDPHHQPPAASGFRPMPLHRSAVLNSKRSPQRSPLYQEHRFPAFASVMGTPPVEGKDASQLPVTTGLRVGGNDDGEDGLDGSWKLQLDDNDDNDDNDHDNDDEQELVDDPGVLGLVRQFKKATD